MDPEQTPDAAADAASPTAPLPPVPAAPAGAAGAAAPAGPAGLAGPEVPPAPAPPPAAGWSAPGAPPAPAARQYPAPIGWVIAGVILFWPTAIPALLASHRSARAAGAGDAPTADREAASAKRWGIVSVCVGAALVVLSVVVSIVWALVVLVAVHEHRDGDGPHRGWSSNELPFGRSEGSGPGQQAVPGGRGQSGQSGPGRIAPGQGSGSGSNGSGSSGSNGSNGNGSGGSSGRSNGDGSGRSGFGQRGPVPSPSATPGSGSTGSNG